MMFYIVCIIALIPKQLLAEFSGDFFNTCYKASSSSILMFDLKYSDKVNFKPPKLTMSVYAASYITSTKAVVREVEETYIVEAGVTGCIPLLVKVPRYSDDAGHHSFSFHTFRFGTFIVENFAINADSDGTGTIIGTEERASMNVIVRADNEVIQYVMKGITNTKCVQPGC
ncbi:hypothetical protein RF11_14670 [Thelohanellus kitauei]|uniref:Uncharacterized protein n=1 Tax=Thelohanellus kitauei TaxID=669202 RepID=A0A0C2J4Q6_THEKT|nr:hypothetical protein RF11_14670 [Thelohanellus kitauei]